MTYFEIFRPSNCKTIKEQIEWRLINAVFSVILIIDALIFICSLSLIYSDLSLWFITTMMNHLDKKEQRKSQD